MSSKAWLVLGLLLMEFVAATALACAQAGREIPLGSEKRPVTVADAIRMTRLADPDYFSGQSSQGRVAQFSPDGRHFFVVLKKGNVERNTTEFSVLLFRTSRVFGSPRAELLLKMSSSSNRDAIRKIRWLPDDKTIAFIGENPGEAPQVYTLDIRSRRIRKLTQHPTAITNYDISADCQNILFVADPSPHKKTLHANLLRDDVIIEGQDIRDLVAGNYELSAGQQVFLQNRRHNVVELPIDPRYYVHDSSRISISPDGKYALVGVSVRNLPAEWARYENKFVRQVVAGNVNGQISPLKLYLLFKASGRFLGPAVNAPMVGFGDAQWTLDGRALLLRTYLPLDVTDPLELAAREKKEHVVRITLPGLEIAQEDDDTRLGEVSTPAPLDVTLEEDLNTPPKIYVFDRNANRKALLLDLNPQFRELDLGRVEIVEWKANGIPVIGGLYLPPDYTPGKRYPLVIQTHGFPDDRFSMDGLQEWSSGYAARPLAANGIIVLQAQKFKSRYDHDHYNDGQRFGVNESQAGRKWSVAAYRAAIDALDERGIIDRDRVGIVGFSITVCFVADMLTHSNFRFAAASLVDGTDCGYFQKIAFPFGTWTRDAINGGAAPFGDGLQTWLKESPGFSLDKVNAPVRLVELGGMGRDCGTALELWEWYAGLSFQKKPVDFILLPDAVHLIVKPWERMAAQQGLVDWFRFWLKQEEDPSPGKKAQYARWRDLRSKQLLGMSATGGVDREFPSRMNLP